VLGQMNSYNTWFQKEYRLLRCVPDTMSRPNRLNAFQWSLQVAWYIGDTTESLAFLSSGTVDVAVTYNPAAEKRLLDLGDAVERVYGYNVRLS
jgi:hypothetical protein